MKLLKLTLVLVFVCALFSLDRTAEAEQKFVPWKQGDYTIEREKVGFWIDARISGGYEGRYDMRRDGAFMGDKQGSKIRQDIILDIESKVNYNISLKVTIGNRSPALRDQESAYQAGDKAERGQTADETGMDLVFKQAYLEYNHNPSAALKMGKHHIYPGDGKGLIFRGEVLALTQECSIGTWCYYIGVARLNNNGDDALFWGHLRYPVYQSGVKIPDLWHKEGTREQTSFNVELFRVSYQGKDIPLSKGGGWTGEQSIYHDATSDSTNDNRRVYFDNDKIEYMGLNLKWNFYKFKLDFTYIGLNGSRDYYSGAANNSESSFLGGRAVSGFAYYLNADYMFTKYWKLGLTFFTSSGNDNDEDGVRYWQRDSHAFQEIQKGSYYDALIYFDIRNSISDRYLLTGSRIGDGHSVSNLRYLALKYSMKLVQKKLELDVNLYHFRRTTPVFVDNVGDNKKESEIGDELDLRVRWMLEKNLELNFFAALFKPRGAYAANDSLRPMKDDQELFSLIGASCAYTF